ncbi:MAG: hypothetical protein ABIO70_17720 [Pseudomonadota bacterium]
MRRMLFLALPITLTACGDDADLQAQLDDANATIDDLQVQITSLEETVAALAAQVSGLDEIASGLDSLPGELDVIDAVLDEHEASLGRLDAGLDDARADIAANADAIATLRIDVDANRAELEALPDGYASLEALADLRGFAESNRTDIDAISGTYATLTALAALQAEVDTHAGDLAIVQADYLTSADRTAFEAALDDLVVDYELAGLQGHLPDLDGLFTLLEVDSAAALLTLDADLDVTGAASVSETLEVADNITGENLVFRQCDGGTYLCTPMECLQECIDHGERMATEDELYAYASAGLNHCGYVWHLDSANLDYPVRGYPMYSNRTTSGCGSTGTGDIPRIVGKSVGTWADTTSVDCACATIN